MKKTIIWISTLAAVALAVFLLITLVLRADREAAMPQPVSEPQTVSVPSETPEDEIVVVTPPPFTVEIRLNGDEELVLEVGESFTDPGAEAWLTYPDGTGEELAVATSAAVDTSRPGTAEIRYTAVREGETLAEISRSVTVRDTTPPVITLLGEPGERDYTAADNADGDLTDRVQRTEESDRIVYTVSDSAGNEARAERMKAPTLRLAIGENVQIPADYRFVDPGYTAQDMYGRDLSDRVQVEGKVIPWRLGKYSLRYSLTDDEGQSVSAERTVEIVAAELPETVMQEKVIYLTFDDGPAETTEALLDMLAQYDAKVTFFVTNTDPRYTDLIGRAYREGHSIGVHGYVHDASKLYANETAFFDYFDKMEELIHEQTGEYTRIVRFVGGSSNTASKNFCPGIMTALAEDLTLMGYRYYDWNIEPETQTNEIRAAARNIISNVYVMNEEGITVPISLQHDTGGWACYVAELVIQWGIENGYAFKGIDLTTPEVHHYIRN